MALRRGTDLKGAKGEAFLFERSIDIETYDRHAEKLREEITLVRIDSLPLRGRQDFEAILELAQHNYNKAHAACERRREDVARF